VGLSGVRHQRPTANTPVRLEVAGQGLGRGEGEAAAKFRERTAFGTGRKNEENNLKPIDEPTSIGVPQW